METVQLIAAAMPVVPISLHRPHDPVNVGLRLRIECPVLGERYRAERAASHQELMFHKDLEGLYCSFLCDMAHGLVDEIFKEHCR